MSDQTPSRLSRLDPATWRRERQTRALFLPAILALGCLAVAPLLPEAIVWTHAGKALALSLPRWLMALWLPWGLLLGLRARVLVAPALVLGIFGLALAGNPVPPAAGVGWKVLSTNVNAYSDDPDPKHLSDAVAAQSPDLVIAVEKRLLTVPGMVRVADDLDADLPRESHAITVFCRAGTDCAAEVLPEFGSETTKMPLATARLGGNLCVLGMHAPPPVPYNSTGILPYVATILEHVSDGRISQDWGVCRVGDPAALAGDLNGVPFSTAWRRLYNGGLTPVQQTRGIFAASWPAGGGWLDLPVLQLDHVFAGKAEVSGARTLRMPGSDHKAILWWVRAPDGDTESHETRPGEAVP